MKNSLEKNITAKSLLKFALPTIISMVFMGIYTSIDGIFVARFVGTNALSAVNIAFPAVMLVIALGTMFGAGGSAVVAKKMGEGKLKEARSNFSFINIVAFLVGVVLAVLFFFFLTPIMRFLGADDNLLPFCVDYVKIMIFFLPLCILSMIMQMFFITAGKATLGLIFSVTGGVVNIILDLIFMGVLKMGIKGAGIATGIGYAVAGLLGIIYFAFNRKGILYFSKPKFDGKVLLKTCTNGSSEMVTNLSNGLVTFLFNLTLMRLIGADGVAAITIVLYTQGLLSSIYFGYSMGIAPLISYNFGKQDEHRLQRIHTLSVRVIAIISVATLALALGLSQFLILIFTPKGSAVYELAHGGFLLFAIAFIFIGYNIYGSALFTALSNGLVSSILSFMRTLVLVSIAILTLPLIFGLTGVWIAVPIAEGLSFILTAILIKKYKKTYGLKPSLNEED